MVKSMTPFSGEGKDLSDLLRERLSIPDGVQWFEVRFAVGEPVTVKCQYTPEPLPYEPAEDDARDPQAPDYGGLNG